MKANPESESNNCELGARASYREKYAALVLPSAISERSRVRAVSPFGRLLAGRRANTAVPTTPLFHIDDESWRYCRSTIVRSTNQLCGETKPFTFLLKARGFRSCTMNSHGGLSTSRSCAIA